MEAVIADFAGRQHGVVTRGQLVGAGVPPSGVDRRVQAGWLRPVHRGVYRVGPVEAPNSRAVAACLACGESAVVSHRSAGVLWKMLPPGRSHTSVEVTVRAGQRRPRGVRVYRIGTLAADEVTERAGVPVTRPARTLFDLAGTVASRELERALAEALALRLTTSEQVQRALDRHSGRPGSRRLRAVLACGQPALTRSEAEERFLALIRRAQLDPPAANTGVEGHEVDFLWRAQGLVVEIDGFAFHSSKTSFESDRRRDALLAAAGLRVVRVTWRQLNDEPEAVLARLAQALVIGGVVSR